MPAGRKSKPGSSKVSVQFPAIADEELSGPEPEEVDSPQGELIAAS